MRAIRTYSNLNLKESKKIQNSTVYSTEHAYIQYCTVVLFGNTVHYWYTHTVYRLLYARICSYVFLYAQICSYVFLYAQICSYVFLYAQIRIYVFLYAQICSPYVFLYAQIRIYVFLYAQIYCTHVRFAATD